MKLLRSPGGNFKMGSPEGEEGRSDDEAQHEVELTEAFYLGAYEVTQKQFQQVMGYNPSHFSHNGTGKKGVEYTFSRPAEGKGMVPEDTSAFPVENVSWEEAVEFCKKLTDKERKEGKISSEQEYRLPTEAQWERACRGGAASYQVFHLGDKLSSKDANFDGRLPYGGASKGDCL